MNKKYFLYRIFESLVIFCNIAIAYFLFPIFSKIEPTKGLAIGLCLLLIFCSNIVCYVIFIIKAKKTRLLKKNNLLIVFINIFSSCLILTVVLRILSLDNNFIFSKTSALSILLILAFIIGVSVANVFILKEKKTL